MAKSISSSITSHPSSPSFLLSPISSPSSSCSNYSNCSSVNSRQSNKINSKLSSKKTDLKRFTKEINNPKDVDRRKRLAANARERKRMHLLNKAYDKLRSKLVGASNKSKYDVLVQAKEYIQALATVREKLDKEKEIEHENNLELKITTTNNDELPTDCLKIKQNNLKSKMSAPIKIEQTTPLDMTTMIYYDNDSCISPLSTTSSISSTNCSTYLSLESSTKCQLSPINPTSSSTTSTPVYYNNTTSQYYNTYKNYYYNNNNNNCDSINQQQHHFATYT